MFIKEEIKMPKKLMDCVEAVKSRGGKSAKYAWPICIKSLNIKKVGKHKWKKKIK
jgi:hypothetical protein